MFPYIGNFIIPTDEVIFFRGVAQLPTRTAETKNCPVQVSGRPFEVSFVAGDGEAHSRLVLSMVDFEVSEVMGGPPNHPSHG